MDLLRWMRVSPLKNASQTVQCQRQLSCSLPACCIQGLLTRLLPTPSHENSMKWTGLHKMFASAHIRCLETVVETSSSCLLTVNDNLCLWFSTLIVCHIPGRIREHLVHQTTWNTFTVALPSWLRSRLFCLIVWCVWISNRWCNLSAHVLCEASCKLK